MAITVKQLEAQVKELQAALAGVLGREVVQTAYDPTAQQPDFIAHGSPEHAALLGLVEVDGASDDDFITYTSLNSKHTFRLEDQVTAFMHFADPMQVAKLTLRQKVSELEAGVPPVPDNAPKLWVPTFVP